MYGVKTGGFDSLESLHDYYDGVEAGLRCFAWWRDGTQYVGTTGHTLAQALDDVDVVRKSADKRMKASEKERQIAREQERKALGAGSVRVKVTTENVAEEHVLRFVETLRAQGIEAEVVDAETFDAEDEPADDGDELADGETPQTGRRRRKKANADKDAKTDAVQADAR